MSGLVYLGDATDHGGKVITASSTIIIGGKPVALKGDLVDCPKKDHGVNPIVEGDDGWLDNGRAVVRHGHRSACGCHVISSNSSVSIE